VNGTLRRWLGTTWKMSPARMYSCALRTTAWYSSRVKLERKSDSSIAAGTRVSG